MWHATLPKLGKSILAANLALALASAALASASMFPLGAAF
jgi:hypothetical protein